MNWNTFIFLSNLVKTNPIMSGLIIRDLNSMNEVRNSNLTVINVPKKKILLLSHVKTKLNLQSDD